MTCKLARKRKKHLDWVIKYKKNLIELRFFQFPDLRIRKNFLSSVMKRRYLFCSEYNAKFVQRYDHDSLSFFVFEDPEPSQIEVGMLICINTVASSTVKRSRIKNAFLEYSIMTFEEYEIKTGKPLNAVLLYATLLEKSKK